MRRLAAALLVACATLTPGGAGARASTRVPAARMLVYAQEWSLWASRPSVPHGKVIVQVWNRGQDAHDLHVQRLDRHGRLVGAPQSVAITESGARSQGTWHLRRGRYELYCSLPGHYQRGMHAVLIVR